MRNQPSQSILIRKFVGEADDSELLKLIPFLKSLSRCQDVRPVMLKHSVFFESLDQGDKTPIKPWIGGQTLADPAKVEEEKQEQPKKEQVENDDSTKQENLNTFNFEESHEELMTVREPSLDKKVRLLVLEWKGQNSKDSTPKRYEKVEVEIECDSNSSTASTTNIRRETFTFGPARIKLEDCIDFDDDEETHSPSQNMANTPNLKMRARIFVQN